MTRFHFAQLLCLLPLSSCRLLPPAVTRPVKKLVFEAVSGESNELVVMLPGRYSSPMEFAREGMVALVQKKRPNARVVVPDLHLGYYMNRTVEMCLWEEILSPASKQGMKVTLVGVSMGGLGALIAALKYPQSVREVFLLAPYLGEPALMAEIAQAGGLALWKPGTVEAVNKDSSMRLLWARLQKAWLPIGQRKIPVALACGLRDRHLTSNRFFAQSLLTSENYHEVPGGHDWPAWRLGLQAMLK